MPWPLLWMLYIPSIEMDFQVDIYFSLVVLGDYSAVIACGFPTGIGHMQVIPIHPKYLRLFHISYRSETSNLIFSPHLIHIC